MKAVLLHEYGKPSLLKWEDAEDPKPGKGEILVRVQAASVNPVDFKRRSGAAAEKFPVQFPGILGRDFAGVIRELGEGVENFAVGDRVFGMAWETYAELCVVKADVIAKIPEGVDITTAAAIPLVAATGDQLIRDAAKAQKGDAIVLTGMTGSVGRCAAFTAKELEVKVIGGVRKKSLDEARALGAVDAIDLEDDKSIALLGFVDAVADTVGGAAGTKLIGKVKAGGNYGSIVGVPKNASLHPTVNTCAIMAHPAPETYVHFAEAIRDGKLSLPIERVMPMTDAAEAHAMAEKGGVGKIVLTA
ncbi:NADP-dependent oxidoreductase [Granulicella cerasi]|uniref:NADP-dependent oxidoreductase n=1 Tax=Granulicella cerasi TaxID=741063 RepID=A0ABW1ZAW5_9BACT|nr:NADP-dependent oxidoreductase [Granulicella cerasi]